MWIKAVKNLCFNDIFTTKKGIFAYLICRKNLIAKQDKNTEREKTWKRI